MGGFKVPAFEDVLYMKLRVLLSSIAFLIGFAFVTFSQDRGVAETADRYLTVRTDMGGFSGAVLIAKDGAVLLRKGYGFADVERRIPYTPETRHEVASISKMFTSAAVLRLRDAGKVDLDDPICRYLDDCPASWTAITIRHLMNHTSGIPDYEEKLGLGSDKYLEFMTRPEASRQIVENAKKLPLDFKPGEKFNYSNTGYIILSCVVQKAAGMDFADYVENQILLPAGMKHSGVIRPGKLPKGLALPYTRPDLGWEKTLAGIPLTDGHLKRLPQLSLTPPEGDAWLYTTVDDLFHWSLIMDDGGKMFTKRDLTEIFTPGKENYGYGWFVGKGFDRVRYRHNGALPGYYSDFIKFPDDKITIILFSNLDRSRLQAIARDISAIVLGTPYDMPIRGTVVKLTAGQIAKLEGTFKTTDGRLLTIKNGPDVLTAKLEGRFTAGLIPLSPTEFYFPLGDGKAVFAIGQNGTAETVNLRYSGEDHVATRVN